MAAVEVVRQVVPDRQGDYGSGGVFATVSCLRQVLVGAGHLAEEDDLFAREEAADDEEPVPVELGTVVIRRAEPGHGGAHPGRREEEGSGPLGVPDDVESMACAAASSHLYRPVAWPVAAGSNRVLAGTTPIAQTQCSTATGVKGVLPLRRRRHLNEEPWHTTGVPFGETSVEDSLTTPLASQSPRVGWGGHATRCPRLDAQGFQQFSTGQASGDAGAWPPCIPASARAPGPRLGQPCWMARQHGTPPNAPVSVRPVVPSETGHSESHARALGQISPGASRRPGLDWNAVRQFPTIEDG